MIENPQELIKDFVKATNERLNIQISVEDIAHELLIAPHQPGDLRPGHGAVYVFTLTSSSVALAGPNRALKVGKAGPKSNARFRYQHYKSGSSNSTLAGAIENNPILWSFIGLTILNKYVGEWIRENTDRDNFYIAEDKKELIYLFEVYVKARLGPVFEGSLSSKA